MRGYIGDTTEISNYYTEYLRLVNNFRDLTRPSIFLRYFNINQNASEFHRGVEASFDRYSTGVVYDVYDFTPTYETNQLVNSAQERSDLIGKQFDSSGFSVTLYTIDKPRFGDLITFPYAPLSKKEIFRVKEISTPLNSHRKDVKYFTLGLEYASLTSTSELKLSRPFVYLLPSEKNIDQTLYKQILFSANKINTLLESLSYDPKLELYVDSNRNLAPLSINKSIYDNLNSNRYFDKIKKPFGVCSYLTNINTGIDSFSKNIITISENKATTKNIVDYTLDQNNLIYDVNQFLIDFTNLLASSGSSTIAKSSISLIGETPDITVGNNVLTGSGLVDTSNLLNINVDNLTIEVINNKLQVKDGGISKNKLNANVAGTGLKQSTDGSLALNVITGEILAGIKDGSNLIFILANVPAPSSEVVYYNGVRLIRSIEYSINGATITLKVSAPQIGDSLIADYILP